MTKNYNMIAKEHKKLRYDKKKKELKYYWKKNKELM